MSVVLIQTFIRSPENKESTQENLELLYFFLSNEIM